MINASCPEQKRALASSHSYCVYVPLLRNVNVVGVRWSMCGGCVTLCIMETGNMGHKYSRILELTIGSLPLLW